VLQQSALSANDAYCEPQKQAALLGVVLDVIARCQILVQKGVPASAIEEVDFSLLTRIRDATPPDAVAEVEQIYARIAPSLGALE
jgi:V/A-type H+-transporting ATPase subunit A